MCPFNKIKCLKLCLCYENFHLLKLINNENNYNRLKKKVLILGNRGNIR